MEIKIDLTKSLQENANDYFEKAKKARQKIKGAQKALEHTKNLLKQEEEKHQKILVQQSKKPYKKFWYHKYRWSKTVNGLLVVAGTNKSSNEAIIKHHTNPDDIVLHTDMAGSPFAVIYGQEVTKEDIEDAALIVGCYSRAWKNNLSSIEVFYVKANQVSKTAQSGESLPSGAFVIRGETKYVRTPLKLCVGAIEEENTQNQVFVGSERACKKYCSKYLALVPGDMKTSQAAKIIASKLDLLLDDVIRALPAGGVNVLG